MKVEKYKMSRAGTFFLDLYRYLFWGPFRRIVSSLSLSGICRLESVFAAAAFRCSPNRKEVLRRELQTSYGDAWSSQYIFEAIRHSYRIYFAAKFRMFLLPRLNESNISDHIAFEGKAHLDDALSKGKGVLILNPHFGPFMMIMPALGYRGYDVIQMALQEGTDMMWRKGLDALAYKMKFTGIEENMPVPFINSAKGIKAIRQVYRALGKNRIVLFPSTGRGGQSFHKVRLMNRKALLTTAPYRMALKTGAVMIPAFVFSENRGIVLRLEPAIHTEKGDSPEKVLESYAAVLDRYIAEYPEHFLPYLFETKKSARWDDYPFFEDFRH